MSRTFACLQLLVVATLCLVASSAYAQDGFEGAFARQSRDPLRTNLAAFSQTLATADFDNDHRPDGAVLLDSGPFHSGNSFRIELHLSASVDSDLTFESTEKALSIAARDVNQDGSPDVIVEQALTHRRLYVWLNDGHGGFRKGRVEDFPSNEDPASTQARIPLSPADPPVISLPSQDRYETTVLKTNHISGRPPSAADFHVAASDSPHRTQPVAHLASRAPPQSPSL
jgi:hypothetical protein